MFENSHNLFGFTQAVLFGTLDCQKGLPSTYSWTFAFPVLWFLDASSAFSTHVSCCVCVGCATVQHGGVILVFIH